MTPLEKYRADLARAEFVHDAAQEEAVRALDDLYHRLLAAAPPPSTGWLARLRRSTPRREPEIGLYMWGGVGRGKTYLMDVFFACLPFEEKRRMHFHRFMQKVHLRLRELQGEKNPLTRIAHEFAQLFRVLCFDEFFVTDITDAMILGTLMEALFSEGVTLVATSNIQPDDLYKNGLQRARFLPAIALVNKYTRVMNVDGGKDYRLRLLEQAELFHCPLGPSADAFMEERFATLASGHGRHRQAGNLLVEGRKIATVKAGDDVVWFEFEAICDGPRSQTDYIEIAHEFQTVLVSNVEPMGADTDDRARRFINLVDEFYDRSVKLVITAETPIEDLYTGGHLDFEFERTRSRLLEMQSQEYLAREHMA